MKKIIAALHQGRCLVFSDTYAIKAHPLVLAIQLYQQQTTGKPFGLQAIPGQQLIIPALTFIH